MHIRALRLSRVWHPRPRVLAAVFGVIVVSVVAAGVFGYFVKKQVRANERAGELTGGDPKKGPSFIVQFGCAGCHQIPGIRGPAGKVGPPLADVGARIYLGGRVLNTPQGLVEWITDPRKIDPKSAMPTTGISQDEARDVAAYLLSLRR
jgi:cytochrome c2